MAQGLNYDREKDGLRLDFRGVNTVLPPDQLHEGKFPFAANVRRYLQKAVIGRALQNSALFALASASVNSARRLNDTTPAGPPSGFIIVSSAGSDLYAQGAQVVTGLSGKRTSLVPFRPNASVQPWMYVADDNKMLKVRSDGTTFKMGIKEPQVPASAVLSDFPQDALINPFEIVSQWTPINATVTEGVRTPPTAITAIVFDFGTTGQASVVWPASTNANETLFLNNNLNDPVFVAAAFAAPANTTIGSIAYDSGTTGPAWITLATPESVQQGQVYLIGGAGSEYVEIQGIQDNAGQTLIRVTTVNTHAPGATLTGEASYRMFFTTGAVAGDTLSDGYVDLTVGGSGSPVQLQGNVVAHFYTHVHAFAGECELRNPTDGPNNPGGAGYPLLATANGNSILLNPPQLTGHPDPNVQPIEWATLDGNGNITGYTIPYPADTDQNWTMTLRATLVFPAAGTYTLQINHDDGIYFGMDSGVGYVSGPQVYGAPTPTLSAEYGFPVIGGNNISSYQTDVWQITVPVGGPVNIEIDYCQWENEQCLNLYVNGMTPVPGASVPLYGMYTFVPAVDQLMGNRQVQLTDLVHLILQANLPGSINAITVSFNVDPNAQDFTTNAFQWTISGSEITAANQWIDLSIPVQALTRIGNGVVVAANVTDGGTGYTQPTTTVSFVGGGGSGAAGTAIVNTSGQVTGIVITSEGSGYSSAPAIVITSTNSPTPGSGAAATALLTGVNIGLTMATGIYGVQIAVSKTAGSVSILFANLIIVGNSGPTVLSNEEDDVWYYTYFSGAPWTGAESNPSPVMRSGLAPGGQGVVLTAVPSPDPQVNTINWYREGGSLAAPVFVGSGPNSTEPFLDDLDDTTVENNNQLEFDNFEPWPSIDLPRAGTCSTNGFDVTWESGDIFNIRWLPGTLMTINGTVYDLYNRPTSTTALEVLQSVGIQSNVPYQIQEPILAAQPMRSMWGPTDNVGYAFGCGDPLRPGTLYFCKGNNLDAAPDTNQMEVTSPSEPLQNGVYVGGISLVMSTERGWLTYPNFFSALATVTGVQGSAFTMVLSIADRGLFAKKGICVDAGATVYFIGKDGIYRSPGGSGSASITDEDLYNLFPHEVTPGVYSVPKNVVLAGFTIYAPDFTNPDAMALSFAVGYVYFDYEDVNGNPRTLVYDVYAKGWVPDFYQFPATYHFEQEGPAMGTLTGCSDGSIRQLVGAGVEVQNAILLMPCMNAGDTRAQKRWGDIYLEALVPANLQVLITIFTNLYQSQVTGTIPSQLVSQGAIRAPYILDFAQGLGLYARDLDAVLQWTLNNQTALYVYQPSLVPQPEGVQNRPTDWTDEGVPGMKFVQGLILEADTFGTPKQFLAQDSDTLGMHKPNETPVTFNGQSTLPFTFTPPFLAHSMRLIATDGVQWRIWAAKWIFQPYPERVVQWETEMVSLGVTGWLHLREMNIPTVSVADLTLTITLDHWPTIVLTIPNTGGLFVKQKVTLPANKSKLVGFQIASSQPFVLFQGDVECKVKQWGSDGPYNVVKPFGGPSALGALV
jgi:hypothetical protein